MVSFRYFLSLCSLVPSLAAMGGSGHNVLFIFTDDQDLTLGSLDVMPKLKRLVTNEGAYFKNAFVSTPICCPSRAEVVTGRYMHNTKVTGNGCGGTAFQEGPEQDNIAFFANISGYTNYYSGKYLNNYGQDSVGGAAHIPRGWHEWHALFGNSKFYNYKVSNNGKMESYGNDYFHDYYTDKLKNDSSVWIRQDWDVKAGPFFMMIGAPCSHVPNQFAPQYADRFTNVTAPRLPNWNMAPATSDGPSAKHWMMRQIGPMDSQHIQNSDLIFQDRWRCLQSMDDMVEELVDALKSRDQLENTYIVYSSDHGQHLGQFGMGFDKRQLYETDVRVPLLVRGPGIAKGQVVSGLAAHVDLAVTFLDMMDISKPRMMDGMSWLPLVTGRADTVAWRRDLLIEYGGPDVPPTAATAEEHMDQFELHAIALGNTDCGIGFDCRDMGMCGGEHGKCACDAKNNTYRCLRTINETEDSMFCEFDDSEGFVEWYDLQKDPYELTNLATAGGADAAKRLALHERLRDFMLCYGDYCFDPPAGGPPPAPAPPGFEVYSKDGQCLRCAGSCTKEQERLVLGACGSIESTWKSSIDSLSYPEIASGSNMALCLNVDHKICQAGTHVWLHACQGSDTKVHAANHFAWDAATSTIRSVYCNDEKGAMMCLSEDNASDGGLVLAECNSSSAIGFNMSVTEMPMALIV